MFFLNQWPVPARNSYQVMALFSWEFPEQGGKNISKRLWLATCCWSSPSSHTHCQIHFHQAERLGTLQGLLISEEPVQRQHCSKLKTAPVSLQVYIGQWNCYKWLSFPPHLRIAFPSNIMASSCSSPSRWKAAVGESLLARHQLGGWVLINSSGDFPLGDCSC